MDHAVPCTTAVSRGDQVFALRRCWSIGGRSRSGVMMSSTEPRPTGAPPSRTSSTGEGARWWCATVAAARPGEAGSGESSECGDEGAQSMERRSLSSSLRKAVSTSLWHADAVSASLRACAPAISGASSVSHPTRSDRMPIFPPSRMRTAPSNSARLSLISLRSTAPVSSFSAVPISTGSRHAIAFSSCGNETGASPLAASRSSTRRRHARDCVWALVAGALTVDGAPPPMPMHWKCADSGSEGSAAGAAGLARSVPT
eukprot:scaffold22967_cov61-Phaeocystis_antarctica.AAC.1